MIKEKVLLLNSFLLAVFLLIAFGTTSVQAVNQEEILKQYISGLQKNPGDTALREKIIKYVQTMKQKPSLPDEAEKFEGRAEYAVKNAKSASDFLDAAREYEKALLYAPWISSFYFNQGIAYEKAGKLKEARQSFEFYLLAAPNAQDARDIRKRVAGLEYAIEKMGKAASPEVVAEKAKEADAFFSGQWRFTDWRERDCGYGYHNEFVSEGDAVIEYLVYDVNIDDSLLQACGMIAHRAGHREELIRLQRVAARVLETTTVNVITGANMLVRYEFDGEFMVHTRGNRKYYYKRL